MKKITCARCAAFLCGLLVNMAIAAPLPLSMRGGIDIDGLGKSVLLVRSAAAQMQAGRLVSNQFQFSALPDPGLNFRLVAVADFDGNGKSDLAYQDMTQPGEFGDVRVWPNFAPVGVYPLRTVKRAWIVQAVGDLDGDGFGDMAFRFTGDDGIPNDTGVSYVWFQKTAGNYDVFRKRGGAPLSWTLLGAADLNADGAADMIYISPYGQIRALMATNTPARSCANLAAGWVPQGFTAFQLADFTGNGRGDILARNSSTGEVMLLSLNANGLVLPPSAADINDLNASCTSTPLTVAVTTYNLTVSDPTWKFYAAGDFNGDGIFDIAWIKPDNTLVVWLMSPNGGAPTVIANAGTPPAGYSVFQLGIGGGAPATTISGTASAGSPIVGYMTVRDSATPQHVLNNVAIDVNGKFSADTSGMTSPFMFFASGTVGGRPVSYYSAATQADVGGTINITPFTDLMVRNVAAGLADTMFNSPGTMSTNLTIAQLDSKRIQLTNALAPVLAAAGLSTSIDLLRSAFNADHTGLDRFMDLVHVVPGSSASQFLIQNILDSSASLTVNTNTGLLSGTLPATGITASAGTPVDLINNAFAAFSGFFATSLPSPTNPGLNALFSSTFLYNGQSTSAFLNEISSADLIGITFTVLVRSIDLAAGTAIVSIAPRLRNGQTDSGEVWQMTRASNNGSWLINGNQHIAKAEVTAIAQKQIYVGSFQNPSCPSAYTGISFNVNDKAHVGIGSALVTGPGLPQSGVTLVAQLNNTQLRLPSNPCPGGSGDYPLTDTVIASLVDNSSYTMALYQASTPGGTPLATYTAVLFKAPVLNGALGAIAFPTIDNAASVLKAALPSGGTIAANWTIPFGQYGDYLNLCANVSQNSGCTESFADLSGRTGAGISTLVLSPPLSGQYLGSSLSIGANDQFGRRVHANYN